MAEPNPMASPSPHPPYPLKRFRPYMFPTFFAGMALVTAYYFYCKNELQKMEDGIQEHRRRELLQPPKYPDGPPLLK